LLDIQARLTNQSETLDVLFNVLSDTLQHKPNIIGPSEGEDIVAWSEKQFGSPVKEEVEVKSLNHTGGANKNYLEKRKSYAYANEQ